MAIKEHWRKKADNLKINPRDFFKTFRPFLSTKGHKGDIEIHLRTDGDVVEKDQSRVADLFADYFAIIADGIGGDKSKLDSPEDFQDHPSVAAIANNIRNKQQYDIEPISNAHVERTLEKLNERKATGYDGISPKIMKIGAAQLSSSLAILFNLCINNRKWPSQWKRGEWIPTFKRDDAQAINNYRPITVLPCVDKVFEQLLGKQISDKFESQLADCQSAYRKYRSCETTLVGLVEDWKKSKDEGMSVGILSTDMSKAFDSVHQPLLLSKLKFVGILSTDMSKAFDSVHQPLLLSKLKSYGFNDSFVNMLNSYHSDRYNRVRLGSSVSSGWKSVVRGCPQGSSLGPRIWNIFQNDLVYNIDANISMYADDHQIYQTGKGISIVHTKLEESASSATDWYENNLLEGNLKKYQTMFIQNKYGHKEQFCCTEHNTNLNLNGKIIRTSDSLKILGVTIDNKLNFNEHINDVCNKASQRVGVIMRLRNLIPTTAKLVLLKSAILPYLTYCRLVWHFCTASDTRRLERIQEIGLRAVYKDTKSSYHQLLNRANFPTLLNRRLQDLVIHATV